MFHPGWACSPVYLYLCTCTTVVEINCRRKLSGAHATALLPPASLRVPTLTVYTSAPTALVVTRGMCTHCTCSDPALTAWLEYLTVPSPISCGRRNPQPAVAPHWQFSVGEPVKY